MLEGMIVCVRNASCNGTFSHSILLHSETILSVKMKMECRSRCVIPQMHSLFRLTCYKTSFMHAARSPIFLSFHWRFGFAVFLSLKSLFGGGGGGGGQLDSLHWNRLLMWSMKNYTEEDFKRVSHSRRHKMTFSAPVETLFWPILKKVNKM